MEVESTAIDVSDTVEGACAMLAHMALRRNVELCMFVDPRIPKTLQGDPLRLRQVVVNLANNAIKFSSGLERAGRVRVRAELAAASTTQADIVISVADNGIGMDERTLAKLFTAFSQSDTSTTRRYGGSGLGLAISHRLVNMMGGSLVVVSAPDKGSTFTLSLPLPIRDGGDETAPGSTLPSIERVPCMLVGASELVDDLHTYLGAAGCRVLRAVDVDAALVLSGSNAGEVVVIVDAHGSTHWRPEVPAVQQLMHRSRGLIAIRHPARRLWNASESRYFELDCNVLTRRRLFSSIAAIAGLVDAEDPEPQGRHSTGRAAPTRDAALRDGRLILVAEDNDFNQQVITRQLALLGYAADVAADGLEAFARWESTPYALVLTDLHMPGIDGYELTERIRQHASDRRHVPIIALTANALKGEADRCREAGMNRYLTKPVLLDELAAELERWIPRHSKDGAPASDSLPPVLVPGALEQFIGNDPVAVARFLGAFEASATSAVDRIERAVATRDTRTIAEQAHSLKSAARMAGAVTLASLCERAEALARSSQVDELPGLVVDLRSQLAAIHARLLRG
jgi:two-component system sensor histidine kinase/response regulator